MREDLKEISKTFSSEHIENEVITLISENPSSENPFETKLQAKFATSDKSFEKQEELLIEFKGKQHMESSMFSSEKNENEVLALTSEPPSSEGHLDTEFKAKRSPPDQFFNK